VEGENAGGAHHEFAGKIKKSIEERTRCDAGVEKLDGFSTCFGG
jgi:hypothetical protein